MICNVTLTDAAKLSTELKAVKDVLNERVRHHITSSVNLRSNGENLHF